MKHDPLPICPQSFLAMVQVYHQNEKSFNVENHIDDGTDVEDDGEDSGIEEDWFVEEDFPDEEESNPSAEDVGYCDESTNSNAIPGWKKVDQLALPLPT